MSFEDSDVVRSAVRVEGFRDDEFNYQLIRALGMADYGGSTVGECLAVVAEITDGSPSSWTRAFERLARRVEARGSGLPGRRAAGERRDHLLRASTYYRTAEYYGGGTDGDGAGARSQACFSEAAALLDPPVEPSGRPLRRRDPPRATSCRPAATTAAPGAPGRPWSCVGGFDSSAEELYFQLGAPGAERGWNVVVFDGPGQLGLHAHRIPTLTFRPDYEVPLAAVLDAVVGLPGVDAERRRARRPELRLVLRRPCGGHRPAGAAPWWPTRRWWTWAATWRRGWGPTSTGWPGTSVPRT